MSGNAMAQYSQSNKHIKYPCRQYQASFAQDAAYQGCQHKQERIFKTECYTLINEKLEIIRKYYEKFPIIKRLFASYLGNITRYAALNLPIAILLSLLFNNLFFRAERWSVKRMPSRWSYSC